MLVSYLTAFAGTTHGTHLAAGDIPFCDVSHRGSRVASSRISGHDGHYVPALWDQFEQQVGHDMALMYSWFEKTGFHIDLAALRHDVPNLTSWERWRQTNWRLRAKTA